MPEAAGSDESEATWCSFCEEEGKEERRGARGGEVGGKQKWQVEPEATSIHPSCHALSTPPFCSLPYYPSSTLTTHLHIKGKNVQVLLSCQPAVAHCKLPSRGAATHQTARAAAPSLQGVHCSSAPRDL